MPPLLSSSQTPSSPLCTRPLRSLSAPSSATAALRTLPTSMIAVFPLLTPPPLVLPRLVSSNSVVSGWGADCWLTGGPRLSFRWLLVDSLCSCGCVDTGGDVYSWSTGIRPHEDAQRERKLAISIIQFTFQLYLVCKSSLVVSPFVEWLRLIARSTLEVTWRGNTKIRFWYTLIRQPCLRTEVLYLQPKSARPVSTRIFAPILSKRR